MTIQIPISAEAEAKLRVRAAESGEDLPSYVVRLVLHLTEPPTPLDKLSGSIYEAFRASGMTDDGLGDLLEEAKHDMRAERRAKRQP